MAPFVGEEGEKSLSIRKGHCIMSDQKLAGNYLVKKGPSEKKLMFCLFQDTDGTSGCLLRGNLVQFEIENDGLWKEINLLNIPIDSKGHWVTCVILGVEIETWHAESGNVFHVKCRITKADNWEYDPKDSPWCSVYFSINDRTGRMRVFNQNPNPVPRG